MMNFLSQNGVTHYLTLLRVLNYKRVPDRRTKNKRVKPRPHCHRKVRLSPLSRRFLRQSHFSATVWTGLNAITQCDGCIITHLHKNRVVYYLWRFCPIGNLHDCRTSSHLTNSECRLRRAAELRHTELRYAGPKVAGFRTVCISRQSAQT